MSQHDIERDETGQVANPRRTQVSGGRETLREGDSRPAAAGEYYEHPENSENSEENLDTSSNDERGPGLRKP